MKTKIILRAVMLAGILVSTPTMSAYYLIDKEGQHASVNFKVSHLGFSYIIGRFNDFDGSFNYDAKNPELSNVSVTINTRSLDTNHAERDKRLRSEEFLDVDQYPTITFDSTSYRVDDAGDRLIGNLTLRGVTRVIEIDVIQVGEGNDPWGGYRVGFEGNVKLDAIDYGMLEWIGEIEIQLIVEGIRQKP